MYGWYRQEPSIRRVEVEAVEAARETIDALPQGTPVVFLVDTEERAAAFHVTRFVNVIRTTVPEERIPDIRLVVGHPDDYLAGRPTLTGNREHDRLSTAYLEDLRPEPPVVFVVESFNRSGFAEARRLGTSLAPGVVALEWDASSGAAAHSYRANGAGDDPPGLGPAALVWISSRLL
jgi:hypothetical protein